MLSDVETAEELIMIIQERVKILDCDDSLLSDTKSIELLELIKKYIKNNYLKCNYSIQELASNFNLNISKISLFFKEMTGINLVDYVAALRMEKAKELLKTTDLQTKEISTRVGYYNVSSFIRRFKQIEGITPGEYKKIYC